MNFRASNLTSRSQPINFNVLWHFLKLLFFLSVFLSNITFQKGKKFLLLKRQTINFMFLIDICIINSYVKWWITNCVKWRLHSIWNIIWTVGLKFRIVFYKLCIPQCRRFFFFWRWYLFMVWCVYVWYATTTNNVSFIYRKMASSMQLLHFGVLYFYYYSVLLHANILSQFVRLKTKKLFS